LTKNNKLKLSIAERKRRHFSDSFKIQKVREIETGQTKVREICSQFEVSSTAVYFWIEKFGIMKDKKNVWSSSLKATHDNSSN
jgi:transposase-like protein